MIRSAGFTASAAAQEFVVRNSTIEWNASNGIDSSLTNSGAQEVVIRGNRIIKNTGDGMCSISQSPEQHCYQCCSGD